MWSQQIVAEQSSFLDLLGIVDNATILWIRHLDGVQGTRWSFAETIGADAQSPLLRRQRGVPVRWTERKSDQQFPSAIAVGLSWTSWIRWTLAITEPIEQSWFETVTYTRERKINMEKK